ncbi:MAG: flavodoxin-dependent (E)-4-hydroxy-3-methylbut-2-enyl-diphosphate synthase [archaeon]
MITRSVQVGNVAVGGRAPVSIQSMCNTPTTDPDATIGQIHELEEAGCDIVRVAVPDIRSAAALKAIRENISIPLVGDIHFDYRLAVEAAKHCDKIRINPGNLGGRIPDVIRALKDNSIPVRIGVNSGSVEREYRQMPVPEALVKSVIKHIGLFEDNEFYDIVISLKSSDVAETIKANMMIHESCSYPIHLGVTEAGTRFAGTIKSSIGIGSLLSRGIGNTIRVSLTENPVEEVQVAMEILKSLDLRSGRNIISCPTCARKGADIEKIARDIEEATRGIKKPIKIAVMGCEVNGPGEAAHADVGVAAGPRSLIFRKGRVVAKVDNENIVAALLKEIEKI